MGLNIPVVSTTPGPQYAQDVNSSLNKLDQHNHTPGQGVPIPTAALNINASLGMNNFGLLNASLINLASQALPPISGSIYRNNDDLYYVDGTGANVRITQGGAVAVSGAVGFSGLPFGTASASYDNLNQSFIFQSATNTAANVDCGSVLLREISSGANAVTVSSPPALAADYTIRMPSALPLATSAVLLTAAGDLTTSGTASSLSVGTLDVTTLNVLTAETIKNNSGLLEFRDATGVTQFASLTGSSSGLSLNLPDTADNYTFKVNNVTKGVIDNNGVDAQYLTHSNYVVSDIITSSLSSYSEPGEPVVGSVLFTSTQPNQRVILQFGPRTDIIINAYRQPAGYGSSNYIDTGGWRIEIAGPDGFTDVTRYGHLPPPGVNFAVTMDTRVIVLGNIGLYGFNLRPHRSRTTLNEYGWNIQNHRMYIFGMYG